MLKKYPEKELELVSKNLTERERKAFSKKFKSLNSIQAKLEFWQGKLETPYIVFLSIISPYHSFSATPIHDEVIDKYHDFEIILSKDQLKEYNESLIAQFDFYSGLISADVVLNEIRRLKNECREGLTKLKVSKNRKPLIEDYKRSIDALVTRLDKLRQESKDFRFVNFFIGYHGGLSYSQLDLSVEMYEFHELMYRLEGHEIAALKLFLTNDSSGKKLANKRQVFTVKQQLIGLHYLGVFEEIDRIDNATKKAEFLSLLINGDFQNIRAALSSKNSLLYSKLEKEKVSIKENLEVVRETFEKLGLRLVVKAVDADLQKLD